MQSENNETLNEIRIEDYIWYIYLFLIIFALISNHFEKEFITKHNRRDETIFRTINTEIFIVIFIIYIYFVFINYKHLKELPPNASPRDLFFTNAGLVAAILFLIAGGISLYISIASNDEDNFLLNFF